MRIEGELRIQVSAADIRRLLMDYVEQHLRNIGVDPDLFDLELNYLSVIEHTVTVRPRLEVGGSPTQPSLVPSDDHPVPPLHDVPASSSLPEE